MASPPRPKTSTSQPQSARPSLATRGAPNRPTPLAWLVDEVQTEAARLSGAAVTPSVWRSAVGERIAERTRVGRLVRGTLTIYAASAAWANELSFLAHDIITKLRREGLDVKNVRFKVRDMGLPPAAVAQAQPARARALPRAELPASLKARLEQVDDPRLREAIAEAAALSLAAHNKSSR